MKRFMILEMCTLVVVGLSNGCGSFENGAIVKDSINFEILDEQVRLQEPNREFELSVKLSNTTDKGFLMYAFGLTEEAFAEDSIYIDDDKTAGNAIFIFDKKGNQIIPEVSIGGEFHYNEVTLNTLQNVHDKVRQKFITNKFYLEPNSTKKIDLKCRLTYNQLKEGEYKIYLIYNSGNNLSNNVEPAKLKADEERYKAEVFKGWIKSNTIELIVE